MQMWIIGRDSYTRGPFQASFSQRSIHIVEIGSNSIVGIVTEVRYPRKIPPSPAEIWR